MNCEEVLEQLSEYLEPEERDELCRAINEHLQHCRDCSLEVDTLRKVISLVHYQNQERVEVPLKVSHELQAALTREYRDGPKAGRTG